MSDDPSRPPEDEPAEPEPSGGWAPFGRSQDEPAPPHDAPPPPPGAPPPLWSGQDPAAPPPPAAGAPQGWERPQPPPAGGWPAPQPVSAGSWAGAPRTPGNATASLVLGIVGIFVCPIICSLAAIVLGLRARQEIDASGGTLGGRGVATAGLVLGIVGLVFFILLLALAVGGFILTEDL